MSVTIHAIMLYKIDQKESNTNFIYYVIFLDNILFASFVFIAISTETKFTV